MLLQINAKAAYIIGIDLDRGGAQSLLIDLNGKVIDTLSVTYRSKEPKEFIREAVQYSYDHFLKVYHTQVIAVGIGISGIVDQRNSKIIESRLLKIHSLDVSSLFKDFPVPVAIENDANSCAGIEIFHRTYEDPFENAIFVLPRIITHEDQTLQSVELGGAVVVNGDIWYGSRFVTGEFSIQSWFTSPVEKVRFAEEDLKLILSSDRKLKEFIKTVLIKLIPAARMLDPDRIILGSIFAKRFDLVTEVLKDSLSSSWYDEADHALRIRAAEEHEQSIALGAGIYILKNLYGMPHVGDSLSGLSLSWGQILKIRG